MKLEPGDHTFSSSFKAPDLKLNIKDGEKTYLD
jgi:hypothetical protein